MICLHLAEQKHREDYPFAFLATCAVEQDGKTVHVPLGQAIEQILASDKPGRLLGLLLPLQKAGQKSTFLAELVKSDEILYPTAWTVQQAHAFLKDVPIFEEANLTVRVPNWWSTHQGPRLKVALKISDKKQPLAGLDSLLDFTMEATLPNGEPLSPKELASILAAQENLVRVRGQWLELDTLKLQQVLASWRLYEKRGISLAESLRLFSGVQEDATAPLPEHVVDWSTSFEGTRLQAMFAELRSPELCSEQVNSVLAKRLHAQLRPYQLQGILWLWTLSRLGFGGCLADDMGLGKTIQLLSYLILAQHAAPQHKHLIIVPTSLLGNWTAEIRKFAPHLRYQVLHSSEMQLTYEQAPDLTNTDLVITTYGLVSKLHFLTTIPWQTIIIDEAQAIKNPGTKQARAIKTLHGQVKFALTGTPVENSLTDLWSVYDFILPGLLGSSKTFVRHLNHDDPQKNTATHNALQKLIKPYLLRRLKTDKSIINDLPDKTELAAYCTLTPEQATLYKKSVDELTQALTSDVEGIQRRGLVLSYLMRFKQICNHPNQWLGHSHYPPQASGKFLRLQELCEMIAQKGEKVLVFTQFREIIPTLSTFLASIFGKTGLELHGDTNVKERAKLVAQFQQDDGPPFFVLSLKAGGTGLNLTHASHVIHFDRWWNPAVENQATDRAYRIGQKRNVLVHKLICSGTIEEKIDTIINQKRTLVDLVIKDNDEVSLTNLTNDELLEIVSLDLTRALAHDDGAKE